MTTLTFGTARVHLSHNGKRVFSSRHRMTGGVIVGSLVYRQGSLRDACQPQRILSEEEVRFFLNQPYRTHWQAFAGTFKGWNPLLE